MKSLGTARPPLVDLTVCLGRVLGSGGARVWSGKVVGGGCCRVEGVNFNISAITARAQLECQRKKMVFKCLIKFLSSEPLSPVQQHV